MRVTSAESSASGRADDDGRFRLLAANFRSSNCRVTVTDGATSAQASLDECTPTAPPPTTTTTTTTTPPPTTTTTTHDDHDDDDDAAADDDHHLDHDDDHDALPRRPPRPRRRHDATAADDLDDDHDDGAADAGDVHRSPRSRAAALLQRSAQHGGRGVGAYRDRVRLQPGELAEQGLRRGDHCLQPAERERHVHRHRHGAAGTAPHPCSLPAVREPVLERSPYWLANGTGQLTANGVSVPFSFTLPNLTRTIDLTGQNVASATISVSISMSAGRSANQPRVTNPPGSASISVASAVISVESA